MQETSFMFTERPCCSQATHDVNLDLDKFLLGVLAQDFGQSFTLQLLCRCTLAAVFFLVVAAVIFLVIAMPWKHNNKK
jgi:hypothetical protein